MDYIAILDKARLLNNVNKPRAALNILKHLYKLDARNLDIILEVVTAFEKLGEWAKARAMLVKGIRLSPKNCDLWIRLSSIYQADEQKETALKALNKGLSFDLDNLPLLIKKFHLLAELGQVNKMKNLVDETITKYPNEKKILLTERASIYQLLSLNPDEEEEQIKDRYGMARAVKPLKKAINDLSDAMDCDEEDYQISLKLARLYKQLSNYELAILTYDDTLSLINSEAEAFRINIQQERDDCVNDSRNDTVQIDYSLDENMLSAEIVDEITQDLVTVTNMEEAEENSFYSNKVNSANPENKQANPQQSKPISIADNILKNACDPYAGYSPAILVKSARKFCDRVEEEIRKVDFFALGDFEVKGLSQQIARKVFLRLFVSKDNMITAAAIEIKPPRASLFSWLPLLISGRLKTIRYVELESEAADGVFLITNNSAEAHPKAVNNFVKIVNLAENSSVYDNVLAHKIRLQKYGQRSYKVIPGLKGVFAFKERLMRAKNFNGENPVKVKEGETSENQFDKVSYDIKSYFEMIARQTSVADSGALMRDQ